MDKMESIGFYTLSDRRIKSMGEHSPLWRCELILTDKCNFKCVYCRGIRRDCADDMPLATAQEILAIWISDGLKNVRFSGGEPLLYTGLIDLVNQARVGGVANIAVSSNGSMPRSLYAALIAAGVTDFSISLDGCCAEDVDKMAGKKGYFERVAENIKYLAGKVYTTVGVVLTEDNIGKVQETILFADALGVRDIRIISAAQYLKI